MAIVLAVNSFKKLVVRTRLRKEQTKKKKGWNNRNITVSVGGIQGNEVIAKKKEFSVIFYRLTNSIIRLCTFNI